MIERNENLEAALQVYGAELEQSRRFAAERAELERVRQLHMLELERAKQAANRYTALVALAALTVVAIWSIALLYLMSN